MATLKILPKDALIIVDMQNDFMPGGALPVPNALSIIPKINRYIEAFLKAKALIVATRDWHPPDHISFKQRGGPWPTHCVQNTSGAEFHKDLAIPREAVIVSKAFERDKDAYSGFEGTQLDTLLKSRGIKRVFVCGVATEYCVKATALDANKLGYQVFLLKDAIKGIDEPKGSELKALDEMLSEGIVALNIEDIII